VPARAGAHSPHLGGMYPIRPSVPCERGKRGAARRMLQAP
jgi:hypothetical protein